MDESLCNFDTSSVRRGKEVKEVEEVKEVRGRNQVREAALRAESGKVKMENECIAIN